MKKDDIYIVDVSVATLWTAFDSARVIDAPALDNPCDQNNWLQALDYEKKLELCTSNLVQSQVLFGQEVHVLDTKGDWAYVAIPEQASSKNSLGYPGWIPKIQLKEKKNYILKASKVAVVHTALTKLYDDALNPVMELSFQTTLPVKEEQANWVIVQTASGEKCLKKEDVTIYESITHIPKGSGTNIVQYGKMFLDLEYLWGGMSGLGYDCSGFSYTMCKANGYIIPRDAHEQAMEGKDIPLNKIEPGDLLFFAYEEGKGSIHHVGIYYGDNKLLHSPKTGAKIEITPMGGTLYERELCVARRYWE